LTIHCDYYYDSDEKAALGHIFISTIVVNADCENEGSRYHECERCGNNYTSTIPSYGHTYEITDIEGEEGVTIRTYTCNICGYSYKQDLGNQYEEVSNYVEYLFGLYSPYMIYVFIATAAVWSVAIGIALIIAKKNDDKEKAKKMLVNYCIGLVAIFVILVAAPLLVNGIATFISG
jgi:transcription elongation factor Elf1